MKLNDNSQRYKDARQIMSEKLADSRKESAAEKAKRLKEVCSQFGNVEHVTISRGTGTRDGSGGFTWQEGEG